MLQLLRLSLSARRDILLARQRARQVAALLRFEFMDQVCVAAGTFAVAAQVLRQFKSAQLCIGIEDKNLQVFVHTVREARRTPPRGKCPGARAGLVCLVKPLPAQASELSQDDLAWVLRQLNEETSLNMFEEVEHQNQEMLALVHALGRAEDPPRTVPHNQVPPHAA